MSASTATARTASGQGVAAARAASAAPSATPRTSAPRSTKRGNLTVVPTPSVQRMSTGRFAVLVGLIILGGLAASLALNTALGSGAFELLTLQQRHADLMDAQQQAAQGLAMLEAPASLAHRAAALGMTPAAGPAFLNVRTGGLTGSNIPGALSKQAKPVALPAVPAVRTLVDTVVQQSAVHAPPVQTSTATTQALAAALTPAGLVATKHAAASHAAVRHTAAVHRAPATQHAARHRVRIALPVRPAKSGTKSGR